MDFMRGRRLHVSPFIGRDFALLWTGRLVSRLGDQLYEIALAWWVLRSTGSAAAMGLVMALSVLPAVAIGVFAGPLVDRWDRKKILVGSDVARALVIGAVSVLELRGDLSVGIVCAAAVALSVAAALFGPASQAILPSVVEWDVLPRANGLNQSVDGLVTVAGPAVGALCVGAFGFAFVFFADTVSFLVSAILESLLRVRPLGPRSQDSTYWTDLAEGLRFLRGSRALVFVLIAVALAHFFVGGLTASLPVLASAIGSHGIGLLGLLQSSIGVGLWVGALGSAAVARRGTGTRGLFFRVAIFGAVFVALGLLTGLGSRVPLACCLLVGVYGVALSQAVVIWRSLIQMSTPERLLGRVFSISGVAGDALIPLSYAVVGIALQTTGLTFVLFASGIVLLVAGLGVATLARDFWPVVVADDAPDVDTR